MSTEIAVKEHTVAEIAQMAHAVARSGLFGVSSEQQAMALLLVAQANGLHPMKAVERYHIIDGKPAKKADAMLGDFLQSGGKFRWLEYSDKACEAEFSHSGNTVRIRWTIEMAKEAGLVKPRKSGAKSPWQMYPRQMLKARVISEGIRATFPGVSDGFYTPEEVRQFDERPPEKDATPPQAPNIPKRETSAQMDAFSAKALARLKDSLNHCSSLEELEQIDNGLISIQEKMTDEAYTKARQMIQGKYEILTKPGSGIGVFKEQEVAA